MRNIVKISPSILSADFSDFGTAVENLEKWNADYVHCDIMDGVFVPNITFGMGTVKAIRARTTLPLDVHLMITEPEKYIPQFIDIGANIITFHPNASKKVAETLTYIASRGVVAGLVVNPDVELSTIYQYIHLCGVVVIMGVYPGFGAQKLIESVIDKVAELKKYIAEHNLSTVIEFDGGLTMANAYKVLSAGVDITVAGNVVFTSENPNDTIAKLKNYSQLK